MSTKEVKIKHIDIGSRQSLSGTGNMDVADFFVQRKNKNRSVLISRGKTTDAFYTEDSKLYITPREMKMMEEGLKLDRETGKWDSLSSRIVTEFTRYRPSMTSKLQRRFNKSYTALQDDITETSRTVLRHFSMVRLWNLSIVGAMLLGMFSMTMIYRYLGQGAAAGDIRGTSLAANEISVEDEADSLTQYLIADVPSNEKNELEKDIMEMVKGHPIEEMVPYIAEKDRIVAAFLVGIARKESNWGKRVPLLEGQDCYNYWGYRGIRKLMGTGGHTCFNSRKDAVDTVAKRIRTLVEEYELDTPEKMVVWKCGSNCAVTGGQAAANKWISDVNTYFKQLN